MSHRRSSRAGARLPDDQIAQLALRLQRLLPELRQQRPDKVSTARVLQETCNYIRSLHREVDDLSERLHELLADSDCDDAVAAAVRSLLML